MKVEKIITGLNDARVAHIMGLLQQLEAAMPWLVHLNDGDRQSLQTVDHGRFPHVVYAAEITRDYHDKLMIDQVEVDDTAECFFNFKSHRDIRLRAKTFLDGVTDTEMVFGARMFEKARAVRALVHVAELRHVPGADAWAEEMDKLHNKQGRRRNRSEVDQSGGGSNLPSDTDVA